VSIADEVKGREILDRIAVEFERRGFTAEEVGRLCRVSAWQGMTKNNDGEAEIHDLYGFQLTPSWDDGPQWPVVQPGPVVKVAPPRKVTAPSTETPCVAVLPDMQIGYYRQPNGTLEPTHDTGAIDVALSVVAAARPVRVVLLGDNLDLPEFGKYRLTPSFAGTTQATIDYATELAARLRAAVGPDCRIDWLAGNHEERMQNWVVDNARASFGLRQGGRPDSWPVMSVPNLCRLDEQAITYHPGYPAADVWLTPRLRIIHGTRVKSKGSTAHLYLDNEKTSVIYGHIHRIERAHRTRTDHDGPREIMAASPGCLARIDGAVPSMGQGLDLDGRPLTRTEDWQTGIAVVTLTDDDGGFDYEQVRIDAGVAWWRGRRFEA
jgi:hypothetical protein